MTIISASRRTDIPAFYADWFMERVRAGFVRWPHLYGGQPGEVSLRPEDVAAIVFWSKDYRPLLPYLDELDAMGYALCFHFTITGLPRAIEPNVPDAMDSVAVARELADRYGPESVFWRFDPILVSSITTIDERFSRYVELAELLAGATRRCFISFPSLYSKVRRNMAELEERTGIEAAPLCPDAQLALARRIAGVAAGVGIQVHSCCGEHLVCDEVHAAHCIDGELLRRLFPSHVGRTALRPTRKQCGCSASIDIGAYNTCPHGCAYCYANVNKEAAQANRQRHSPTDDMMTGPSRLPAPDPTLPDQLALFANP